MEAIRRPKTVMETLDEFKARYPRERFIYVNAPVETAGAWPEHYGLGARVFRVPTDNMMAYTSPKTGKTSRNNGWIFELAGNWLLMKPSKLQLMHDAGIVFARNQMHRMDDGSDPKLCELEGSAAMLTISGLIAVTGRKRIDLAISSRVQQEFLVENCETKLELRLGMKLLGIPQVFTMDELKAKEFVTFCVYSAPHATNAQERMVILQHHLGIYGPAFGGTKELSSGDAVAVKMIDAGPERPGEDAEFTEVTTEDNDPADQQPSPGGEVGAAQSPSLPLGDAPPPPGSEKITHEKIDFLQAIRPLKDELLNLLGALKGSEEYYKLMLATTGCQHANQIPAGEKQGTFYRKLERMVKLLKENPKVKEPVKPFAEALALAREGYAKLAIEKLVERIEAQMELQKYPTDLDPLEIVPVLQEGNKAKCVDAAVRLMERGLIETTKMREQKQADPRGGAR